MKMWIASYKHSVNMSKALSRVAVHSLVQYKSDLWASIIASILSALTALIGIFIVSINSEYINGWNRTALILLLGVHYIIGALVGFSVTPSLEETIDRIRDGSFDYLVVQPIDSQFHAGIRVFRVEALAGIITGSVLIAFASTQLHITWVSVGLFLLTLIAGVFCVIGWQYVVAGMAFTFIKVDTLFVAFDQLYEQAGRWPISVFPAYSQAILSFIFPILLCVSVPASTLESGFATTWGVPALLTTAALFLLLSRFVWIRGLKKYVGGSS